MARGGARTRSGPQPTEGSRTSDRKGYVLTALPTAGYDGAAPNLKDYLPNATLRHEAIWTELWQTPQACAWSEERYRWPVVADLVKWMVRSEADDAPVGTATNVKQLREECGIGATGLKLNGWKIAEAPTLAADDAPASNVTDIKSRLAGGA